MCLLWDVLVLFCMQELMESDKEEKTKAERKWYINIDKIKENIV